MSLKYSESVRDFTLAGSHQWPFQKALIIKLSSNGFQPGEHLVIQAGTSDDQSYASWRYFISRHMFLSSQKVWHIPQISHNSETLWCALLSVSNLGQGIYEGYGNSFKISLNTISPSNSPNFLVQITSVEKRKGISSVHVLINFFKAHIHHQTGTISSSYFFCFFFNKPCDSR